MEFFHSVNIDWMGKAKYFVALSLFLLVIGGSPCFAMAAFTTASISTAAPWSMCAFPSAPPIDKIRSGLERRPAEQHHPAVSESPMQIPEMTW